MAVLSFTLSSEAVGKLNNTLICLGRFSDSVSIESNKDQLVLSALNSTKSAYASFTLSAGKFFTKYSYNPPRVHGQLPREKFTCRIYNKALLSVFKGRAVDPLREKDISVEKCDVAIEDGAGEVQSRFVVRIFCKHGVLKTYRLTFESEKSMHALFHSELAKNRWTISSRALREFVDHFGAGTEQLDIYSEDGRASFTSYTEKIMSGNEILKQPLHTTIVMDTLEFTEFSVEEKLHIVICVKDFKAIVTHAGISNTHISARYSHPSKPMQLKYNDDGMVCEFILMTIGDFRGSSSTPAPIVAKGNSSKFTSRQPLKASANRNGDDTASPMPPPLHSVAQNVVREPVKPMALRPSPPPPQPSLQLSELFFPENDDKRWDPVEEDDEETLGWDASAVDDFTVATLNRSPQRNQAQNQSTRGNEQGDKSAQRLEPTQRISQIRGFFDN